MAITLVGTASATGNSAGFNVSLTALTGGTGAAALPGDLVVAVNAFASTADGNPGVSTSGYTEVGGADLYANGTTQDTNLSVNYKIMPATADTVVGVNGSGTATNGAAGIVIVLRDVDPINVLDVAATSGTGTGTTAPTCPAITPLTQGSYILIIAASGTASYDAAVTMPAGFTQVNHTGVDPGNAIQLNVGRLTTQWYSGTVTPAIYTGWTTGSAGSRCMYTLAIRQDFGPNMMMPMMGAGV